MTKKVALSGFRPKKVKEKMFSMRFNGKSLFHYFFNHQATHEGPLSYQTPKGEPPKIKQFKLIGNLLFHYRGSEVGGSVDDTGVLVIESCAVNLIGVPGQQSRKFSIAFDGELGKKHFFTAPTAKECESWMTVLNMASYQNLQATIARLRQRLKSRTGTDPCPAIQNRIFPKLGHKMVPQQNTSHIMHMSQSARSATVGRKQEKPAATLERRQDKPTKPIPKSRSKNKLGSTFYTGQDAVSNQTDSNSQRNSKENDPQVPKSKFFAQLDVVKASGTSQDTSSERPVSSTVNELRKAMTLDRNTSKSNRSCSALTLPNPARAGDRRGVTGPPGFLERGTASSHSTASDALSFDLLQFQTSLDSGRGSDPPLINCGTGPNLIKSSSAVQPPVCTNTCQEQNSSSAINDLLGLQF